MKMAEDEANNFEVERQKRLDVEEIISIRKETTIYRLKYLIKYEEWKKKKKFLYLLLIVF